MFLDTLPPDAKALLEQLGREPLIGSFYLGGGSAVALYLGHRISVDLDFFTPDSFDQDLLVQSLQSIGSLTVRQQGPGTFIGTIGSVRVSFFVYPYPLLEETTFVLGAHVAGVLDIALMKVIAIGQRGTKRDFIDLYYICQQDWRLKNLIEQIPQKYRNISYPSYHLLRSLVYFEDAESDEMPRMRLGCDWNVVKRFFEDEVRVAVDTLL